MPRPGTGRLTLPSMQSIRINAGQNGHTQQKMDVILVIYDASLQHKLIAVGMVSSIAWMNRHLRIYMYTNGLNALDTCSSQNDYPSLQQ